MKGMERTMTIQWLNDLNNNSLKKHEAENR